MFSGLCYPGNWGFLGTFGPSGWIGLIVYLVFWVGLIAGLTLLAVWAMRRSRVGAANFPYSTRQPTATEILQARYARGEITRDQYESKKQDLG